MKCRGNTGLDLTMKRLDFVLWQLGLFCEFWIIIHDSLLLGDSSCIKFFVLAWWKQHFGYV